MLEMPGGQTGLNATTKRTKEHEDFFKVKWPVFVISRVRG
jgi:hypothetical protein